MWMCEDETPVVGLGGGGFGAAVPDQLPGSSSGLMSPPLRNSLENKAAKPIRTGR